MRGGSYLFDSDLLAPTVKKSRRDESKVRDYLAVGSHLYATHCSHYPSAADPEWNGQLFTPPDFGTPTPSPGWGFNFRQRVDGSSPLPRGQSTCGVLLTNVPQGTGANERVGDSIRALSLEIIVDWVTSDFNHQPDAIRWYLFSENLFSRPRPFDAASALACTGPPWSDILAFPSAPGHRLLSNTFSDRFKLLASRSLMCDINITNHAFDGQYFRPTEILTPLAAPSVAPPAGSVLNDNPTPLSWLGPTGLDVCVNNTAPPFGLSGLNLGTDHHKYQQHPHKERGVVIQIDLKGLDVTFQSNSSSASGYVPVRNAIWFYACIEGLPIDTTGISQRPYGPWVILTSRLTFEG